MRGVGEATAAITIVNALPTGIGAAVGIELRAHVEVDLRRTAGSPTSPVEIRPPAAATPLVRSALEFAVERYAAHGFAPVDLTVRSDIPPGAGLKSSSAVSSAIVLAVANATGRTLTPTTVAAASAEIGRATGVSATGAFDDALAGLVAGAVMTDNRADRLLRAFPLPIGLAVALWVPGGTHPPAPETRRRFPTDTPETRAIAQAADAGRLWEAMELNSDLVDAAMGYTYRPTRERLRTAGAIACGTSGLGPALAAVGPRERIPALLAELAREPGRSFSVEFSRAPAPWGVP